MCGGEIGRHYGRLGRQARKYLIGESRKGVLAMRGANPRPHNLHRHPAHEPDAVLGAG